MTVPALWDAIESPLTQGGSDSQRWGGYMGERSDDLSHFKAATWTMPSWRC